MDEAGYTPATRIISLITTAPILLIAPWTIDLLIDVVFNTHVLSHLLVLQLFAIWLFALFRFFLGVFPEVKCTDVLWSDVYLCHVWMSGLLVTLTRLMCEYNMMTIAAERLLNSIWPKLDLMKCKKIRLTYLGLVLLLIIILSMQASQNTELTPGEVSCCTFANITDSETASAYTFMLVPVITNSATVLMSLVNLMLHAYAYLSQSARFQELLENQSKRHIDLFVNIYAVLYVTTIIIRLTRFFCLAKGHHGCTSRLFYINTTFIGAYYMVESLAFLFVIKTVRVRACQSLGRLWINFKQYCCCSKPPPAKKAVKNVVRSETVSGGA